MGFTSNYEGPKREARTTTALQEPSQPPLTMILARSHRIALSLVVTDEHAGWVDVLSGRGRPHGGSTVTHFLPFPSSGKPGPFGPASSLLVSQIVIDRGVG